VPIIPVLALFAGLGVYLAVEQVSDYLNHKEWSKPVYQPILIALVAASIMVAGLRQYYVISSQTYTPNLEQVINWAGLYNPPDTHFYYVNEREDRGTWVPYFFRLELTEPQFVLIEIEDVLNGSAVWPEDQNFSIFYEESSVERLLPIFETEFKPNDFVTFRDRDRNPVGRAIVQGDVDLSTEVPFLAGAGNLLSSRVMGLVIPLLLLELYLLFKMKPGLSLQQVQAGVQNGLRKVQGKIRGPKLADTSPSKTAPRTSPRSSNTFEVGFFIRLGKQNVQTKLVIDHQKDPPENQEEN
jgi:hypothetical protein